MKKRLILWAVLFVIGLLTVIFRMDISRFLSDETALLAGGAILALFSGAWLLTELHLSFNTFFRENRLLNFPLSCICKSPCQRKAERI